MSHFIDAEDGSDFPKRMVMVVTVTMVSSTRRFQMSREPMQRIRAQLNASTYVRHLLAGRGRSIGIGECRVFCFHLPSFLFY